MRNLHFKIPRAARDDRKENSPAGTAQAGWFLREDDFARALSLEAKRVERSRKLLLLMLLDARAVLERPGGDSALCGILSGLASSTRETDMRGWYKKGSVIGVIFTEIAEGEKHLVGEAVLGRVTEHLRLQLNPAGSLDIAISLHFFPEDWGTGVPGTNGNHDLYSGLLRSGDSGKSARILKRAIDVVGSSLAVAALSPLFPLIALLIKLNSKGPVLFRQKRVGRCGRVFECLKFRSMYEVNDPSIHREYVRKLISGAENSQSPPGALRKMENDPRITLVGRFLRKTSLDEIPQFWNVLKGEMSLVGPRPAIPYELECYDIWHRRRVLDVKPGITGLWQVQGRSRMSFDEMVRLDLRYAKSWSIWLDFKILLKTPKVVMSGEGAC